MHPQINGKSLLDCNQDDFKVLLNNPDYRENQYLEYKGDFSFLKAEKDKVQQEIVEFRNDVCSFANSDGGYIVYGIRENQGIATDLIGVEIANPDKFEMDLRNKLTPIMPQIPSLQFKFVPFHNERYLVVAHIEHDYYAPYTHVEDNKNYKIYKRDGNRKKVIEYSELKNMFMQTRGLEDEIRKFRKKRIRYYRNERNLKYEPFMIFHIIPESFLNGRKPLFVIERQTHQNYGTIFANTKIDSPSFPCVDGLRFINTAGKEEALLFNNGIVEFVKPLNDGILPIVEGSFFENDDIWNIVNNISQSYQRIIPDIFGKQRYFGCIGIIGCKDAVTEHDGFDRSPSKIDRDKIICQPIPFIEIGNTDIFYKDLKKLHLEFLLSIGLKRDKMVRQLIEEIESK